MNLSQTEIELFYKLWYMLIWNVNQKHKMIQNFAKPVYGKQFSEEQAYIIRTELWKNPQWIDDFLHNGDCGELTQTERDILTDWRSHFIEGRFLIVKHLAHYSIFMPIGEDDSQLLYGVCGISNPIKDTVPYQLPLMVDAVLLPFQGKIIYDSFLIPLNITFGKGIRASFNESYNTAKKTKGIIECLGETPVMGKPPAMKPKPQKPAPPVVDTQDANVPKAMSSRYMEIAAIVESFCDEKLNDDYKELCLRALQKLCRKRPSPLATGKVRTWACGIVYAIGSNNYIFDKSQPVNMTATEIAEWFGLSKSTAGNKASEINNLLDISYFNTEFLLKEIIDDHPAVWLLNVNGLMVDIRQMPRELQEQAFRKGLIPYIPADRR